MSITEEERLTAIQDYISDIRSRAVRQRWQTLTEEDRKKAAALPVYARKLKNKGIPAAEAWILGRFGEEQGRELLQSRPFKKQWVKYL